MQSNVGKALWYLTAGGFALVVGYYLSVGTQHDLSQAPVAEKTYPPLPSDALPKRPIAMPTEPFASGWTEPSPAQAVEFEAQRTLRENEERQQREMKEKLPVPEDGAPESMMMQTPKN